MRGAHGVAGGCPKEESSVANHRWVHAVELQVLGGALQRIIVNVYADRRKTPQPVKIANQWQPTIHRID